MSDSDRSTRGAIVVGIFAGLVLCLILALAFQAGLINGKAIGENEAEASTYARHADKEIKETCLGLEPVAMAECIRGVIEATNEDQRAEQDLEAQTKMALWAFWMLVATIVMTCITFVGVIYVSLTLQETAAGVLVMRQEQRPWLQVTHEIASDFSWDRETELGRDVPVMQRYINITVRTKVKNLGKLPAYDVHMHQEMFIEPPSVSGRPAFEAVIKRTLTPDYSGQVIFPGEEVTYDWGHGRRVDLLVEKLGGNNGGKIFFGPYIFCSVGYELSSAVSDGKRFTAVARSIGFKHESSSLWLQAIPIKADDLTIRRAPRGADQAT